MRAPFEDEPAQNPQEVAQFTDGSLREPMEHIKNIFDGVSYWVAFTSVLGLLPPMAALASILWIGFQFYHSAPMKERRRKAKARKKNEHF